MKLSQFLAFTGWVSVLALCWLMALDYLPLNWKTGSFLFFFFMIALCASLEYGIVKKP